MDYEKKNDRNDEVYSKVIKAGKRTYFFDIKSTRGNDLFITVTESKKSTENGTESFQKHKIFLYKEDFEKFQEGLEDVINKVAELKKTGEYSEIDF
jgi:hypothetical protein